MSWVELLRDREFTITTGDGAQYRPSWLNAKKDIQYNNRIYNFPGVVGSTVDRREKVGDKLVFELYFSGAENIAEAANFEVSARDQRPWRVIHPFYGTLIVQPLRMRYGNERYNVTKIIVDVIEVVQLVQSVLTPGPADSVIVAKTTLDELAVVAYASNVPTPDADDAVDFGSFIERFDTNIGRIIIDNQDLSDFRELVSQASGFVSELISSSDRLIRSVSTMINFPAVIAQGLDERINGLVESFNNLNAQIFDGADLADIQSSQKNYYLVNAGGIISNIAYASIVNPDAGEDGSYNLRSDYLSRADLVRQIDLIIQYYNQFIQNLNSLTTARADDLDSFAPDFDYLFTLHGIVINTVRNLEAEIFNSVQERELFLVEPSDIITLSHRLYGSASPDNIQSLIDVNSLSLNDVLEVDAGKSIKYYA